MARFQALLTDLADLAAAAAGGCEKNKVAFVQGGTRSSGGRGRDKSGGIRALVGALSLGGGRSGTVPAFAYSRHSVGCSRSCAGSTTSEVPLPTEGADRPQI